MKPSMKRFAPFGLVLSLAAALCALGLYIVYKEFNLYLQISLGCIVIGLAVYAILNPQGIRDAVTGRQAKYGSNAFVLLIAFLGILIVLNFVISKNSKRWDLTEDQEHTLAKETISTLTSLKNNVSASAYFTSRTSKTTAKTLLDEFKSNSDGKFDYSFVDPEQDPVAANADNVTQDGTIVLKIGDRSEQVTSISEIEMISSIIRLSNPGERVVYFLTGHGEDAIDGTDETAYSQAKKALENKNYTVNTLSLLVDPKIPDDALALIIAGNRKAYSESEVALIKEYLKNGGSLVAFLEPSALTDFSNETDPLSQMLVNDYGFVIQDNLVIDTGANPATIAIANSYGSSPIVNTINNNQLYTIFPTARGISFSDTSTYNPVTLVSTSSQTWGETDIEALKNSQAAYDEATDTIGPISLGVSMEDSTAGTRIVVFGDADFASDTYISAYGNTDLFVNTVDWVAQQDSLINLTAKEKTNRLMTTPGTLTMGLILLGSVIILPGAVIVSGIVNWIQRRRRG